MKGIVYKSTGSTFGLGHFAHLTVEPFHGVGGMHDLPDGFGVLEVL